ncbi:MAG: F0F1 ATP synthase subunit A [Armatimonadota bacterium]
MTDSPVQFSTMPLLIAQAHAGEGDAHTLVPPPHGEAAGVAEHAGGGEGHASPWVFFGFALSAFLILTIIGIIGTRRLRLIPRGIQNILEFALESIYGIPETVMGPRGRQYAPFLGTFFLYIFVMNFTSLIPGFKPGTASLSITLGLAIVAFFAVQYFGFRAHGIKYLLHFVGPVPALAILILPLELISEMIRPVSLSIRLYGNIFGEEQVVTALATNFSPLIAVLMLPLQVLTVVLQAFVFTLLVTIYIALATEKHEEHGEHGDAEAHA